MTDYGQGPIAQVIVVGAQPLADALTATGAAWQVLPAVQTITEMWDKIDAGELPTEVTALVITDGTSTQADELESTLSAFAPYADTFLISSALRGEALIQRAKVLATTQPDGDPSKPIFLLPIEDLAASIEIMRQTLEGKVAWPIAPMAPAYVPPAAPQATQPPQQPAYVTPPVMPAQVAPAAPEPFYDTPADVQQQAPNYDQASFYSSEIAEIMAQGTTKLPTAIPGQVTIACMSSKGGSGKSTTAISLAGMIARSSAAAGDPKKVVVVDLDTRDGQVGSLINQYMPTAVSIRVMPRWDAATIQANLVHDKRLGIDALLAPIRPRNADDVGPEFYRQVIQVLQTTHDVVILDCSVNYLDPLLGVGFSLADEILFVTTLATTSVQGMARALTELFADPSEGGLGIPREKVGIVANQVIHNVGMGKDKLLRAALGAPLVGQIPAEHDEVLIQTNSNRMDNLLKHHRLGPAYFKLAQTCLPGWNLAPLTTEANVAVAQQVLPPEPEQKRKRFGR